MLIERVWADNSARNFHYLIACAQTGEAMAVDPLDATRCLNRARELGWTIRQIFNTHEHLDHTGGNAAMVAATSAPVLAHAAAAARIGGVTCGLKDGERGTRIILRRYAVQCGRRQLHPRRRPAAAVRQLRYLPVAPAGRDPRLSRTRIPAA